MATMSGGEALAKSLAREGVEVVFGIPGIQMYGIVAGLRDEPGSVDEQRFCQCKRAATLSVPPSPSEDAAAPVWRPGTPLART